VLVCSFLQKVVFHDSPQKITSFLRPHWTLTLKGRANVVQSLPNMLEILPLRASKGVGVQVLLDHIDVSNDQVIPNNLVLIYLKCVVYTIYTYDSTLVHLIAKFKSDFLTKSNG